ncbi:helix-turn-helix transcriptional regulator [Pseudomonas sp. R2.Fl]|nr:helix-turn-helix transcriptional regulator [Pseudomonas sp. R2.Fl]
MADDRLLRPPSKQALADFVRAWRERTSPESLGLPPARRRRTRGLRREEVAAITGVGLTWYTWFEQGRDISVSDDFLERLARGLRLDRAAREHLFALAGRAKIPDVPNETLLPPSLSKLIRAIDQPAYIMNTAWDVVSYNNAAATLFDDFKIEGCRPNVLRMVFFSGSYREKIENWAHAARLVLLKARHDYLTGGRSPALRMVLDETLRASPLAAGWWDDEEIVRIGDMDITFRNPGGGFDRYRLNILVSEEAAGFRIVFYDFLGFDPR